MCPFFPSGRRAPGPPPSPPAAGRASAGWRRIAAPPSSSPAWKRSRASASAARAVRGDRPLRSPADGRRAARRPAAAIASLRSAEVAHPLQHPVAPLDRPRRVVDGGHAAGRLDHPGDRRRLGERQLGGVLAEVRAGGAGRSGWRCRCGRGRSRSDRPRGSPSCRGATRSRRSARLFGLALERAAARQVDVLDQLLADRAPPPCTSPPRAIDPQGAGDTGGGDAGMVSNPEVLGRQHRLVPPPGPGSAAGVTRTGALSPLRRRTAGEERRLELGTSPPCRPAGSSSTRAPQERDLPAVPPPPRRPGCRGNLRR